MEMYKEFVLSRQAHITTSVNYNLFKMGLSDEAINQYIMLLQNSGTHTHAEFSRELGVSVNTYLREFKELENAGLIRAQNNDPALEYVTEMGRMDRVVILNVQNAYDSHLKTMA